MTQHAGHATHPRESESKKEREREKERESIARSHEAATKKGFAVEREYGTYKTVKARFWSWPPGKSQIMAMAPRKNLTPLLCALLAGSRTCAGQISNPDLGCEEVRPAVPPGQPPLYRQRRCQQVCANVRKYAILDSKRC